MLAAARKYKRVVQVGTQRRSTPHLIEARDRIIKRGQARQDRPSRDLLLLPHAGARQSARHRAARASRLRDVDRPGAAAAVQRDWCTRAAGARSWNTATASSATCASTCSTWSAGCSTSAGRSASAPPAASSWRRTARRTSPTRRRRRSISATCRSSGSTAPGATPPDPEVSLGRDVLRRQGHAQGQRHRATTSSRWARAKPVHRDVDVRAREVSRGQDGEGPGAARRPGHPRAHAGLPDGASTRAASRWPTSSKATSPRRCILANLSLQLGRTLAWDPRGRQGRRRRRSQHAAAPPVSRAVGAPGAGGGLIASPDRRAFLKTLAGTALATAASSQARGGRQRPRARRLHRHRPDRQAAPARLPGAGGLRDRRDLRGLGRAARRRRRHGGQRAGALRRLPPDARPARHRRRRRLDARPLARADDDHGVRRRQGRLRREAADARPARGRVDGRRRAAPSSASCRSGRSSGPARTTSAQGACCRTATSARSAARGSARRATSCRASRRRSASRCRRRSGTCGWARRRRRPTSPTRGLYHFRWFWDYSGGQTTNLLAHEVDIVQWVTGQVPRARRGVCAAPVAHGHRRDA